MATGAGAGRSVPTPNQRVGNALDDLVLIARPVITGALWRAYGDDWFRRAQQGPLARSPRARADGLDAYALLALLSWAWDDTFAGTVPLHARRIIAEVAEARNRWGHQEVFSDAEADAAVHAVADLIAMLTAQASAPAVAGGQAAPPPPPPFRMPRRRAVASMPAASPAPWRARARSRRWPRPHGCIVALVVLLVPGALCGLGSAGVALLGGGRPTATRAAAAPAPTRGVPSPAVAKPTTVAGEADRYAVGNTGGLGVYLRGGPGSPDKLRAYRDGTVMRTVGAVTTTADGTRWHHVRAPDGLEGWVAEAYLIPAP